MTLGEFYARYKKLELRQMLKKIIHKQTLPFDVRHEALKALIKIQSYE